MWRKSGWLFDECGVIQAHQSATGRFIACDEPVDMGKTGCLHFLCSILYTAISTFVYFELKKLLVDYDRNLPWALV